MTEHEQHDLAAIVARLRADIGGRIDPHAAEDARRIAAALRERAAQGDAAAARDLEKYAPYPFEEAQAIVLTAWRADPRRTAARLGEPATEQRRRPAPPQKSSPRSGKARQEKRGDGLPRYPGRNA